MAQRHFELTMKPQVVGLWTADWDNLLDPVTQPVTDRGIWDVVFHGFDLEAKGAQWLEAVATKLPARRFLFPFRKPARATPANCAYVQMNWESGLEAIIRAAPIVAVPSLWSAPIEGALIKTIATAAATAVVENASAFADELPRGLVCVLPRDPWLAAQALEHALREGWHPDPGMKQAWIHSLPTARHKFLDRLFGAVPGFVDRAQQLGAVA